LDATKKLITVYSLPDCPKCDQLKDWLKHQEIPFQSRWFDTEIQTELIMRNMFDNPPILEVDDVVVSSQKLFSKEGVKEDFVLEVLGIGKE
jgi:glutaredoxin